MVGINFLFFGLKVILLVDDATEDVRWFRQTNYPSSRIILEDACCGWIRGSTMFRSGISWINDAKTGLFCEGR